MLCASSSTTAPPPLRKLTSTWPNPKRACWERSVSGQIAARQTGEPPGFLPPVPQPSTQLFVSANFRRGNDSPATSFHLAIPYSSPPVTATLRTLNRRRTSVVAGHWLSVVLNTHAVGEGYPPPSGVCASRVAARRLTHLTPPRLIELPSATSLRPARSTQAEPVPADASVALSARQARQARRALPVGGRHPTGATPAARGAYRRTGPVPHTLTAAALRAAYCRAVLRRPHTP